MNEHLKIGDAKLTLFIFFANKRDKKLNIFCLPNNLEYMARTGLLFDIQVNKL